MLEIATGAKLGGDLQQLVKFLRLPCAVEHNSAWAMATAPKPATADTNDFSSAVKTPSLRG
jgi:hypothetical protein